MSVVAEIKDLQRRRHERPLPRVDVEHGPAVPGGVLKAAATLAAFGLVMLTAARTELLPSLAATAAVVLAGWSLLRPGRMPGHCAVVLSALMLLGSPAAPFDPAVCWLAPLALLAVRLGWWSSHVGWSSRVETAALWHASRRDVLAVGATWLLCGAAWASTSLTVGALVLLGGLAVVVLGWFLLPR